MEMISTVSVGIAVANAEDLLKQKVNYDVKTSMHLEYWKQLNTFI
ncbi:hypothetical protein HCR03_09690 [Caproicibacter fermentans]|uniref:Uncharacterized protein n=1 Tax=Caproicibacter fermentans TaxID=2576756 RepID=A0A7G8TFQ6_9FIRM|nr:hypothetical protein HCR03_09690 [Caproicibacter fermentans]